MDVIKCQNSSDIPENFTGIAILQSGIKFWLRKGKYHREDGPAIEWVDGNKYWYKEGKRHREDGPAIENTSGAKQWWLNDCQYNIFSFKFLIQTSIFIRKEKGKYNLDWLRFLTDQGIQEFPIIPGMDFVKEYLDAVQ